MSNYEKQNFVSGQILKAEHLNNIEDGFDAEIDRLSEEIDNLVDPSVNLLNPAEFMPGWRCVAGGGLSDDLPEYTATSYFPVESGATYYVYRSNTYMYRINYYDANKVYISNSTTDYTVNEFAVPSGAAYARMSTNGVQILDMGIYATPIDHYVPYAYALAETVSLANHIDKAFRASGKCADARETGNRLKAIEAFVPVVEYTCKRGDATMHENERIDLDTGTVITGSSGQLRTDFIPVGVGVNVVTHGCKYIGLYDANKVYLGYINLYTTNASYNPPPADWSGNYRQNIVTLESINGVSPAHMMCWLDHASYETAAVSVLDNRAYEIVCLGDSIFGNNEKPYDIPTYIQNITGIKTANLAFGGTTARVYSNAKFDPICLHSIADCIATGDFASMGSVAYWREQGEGLYNVPTILINRIDWSKVRCVTIAYGTNDWNTGAVSNQIIDNSENKYDVNTYMGALRYSIKTIQEAYPGIRIVLLSPIWREAAEANTNDSGQHLYDYVSAMKTIAHEMHVPFYDNYDCGINAFTASIYLRDGTHLTRDKGAEMLGTIIAKELSSIITNRVD